MILAPFLMQRRWANSPSLEVAEAFPRGPVEM